MAIPEVEQVEDARRGFLRAENLIAQLHKTLPCMRLSASEYKGAELLLNALESYLEDL